MVKDSNTPFDTFTETEMKDAIKEALSVHRSSGRLSPIVGCEGYNFEFVDGWNKFLDHGFEGLETYEANALITGLWSGFIRSVFDARWEFSEEHPDLDREGAEVVEHLRVELAEMLSHGDFTKPFMGASIHSPVSSERVVMTLHEWQPRFHIFEFDTETNKHDYVPLKPLDVKPITHVEVDLPSGEMLIADWLRIREFTELTNRDRDFAIDRAQVRIERTIDGILRFNLLESGYHGASPSIVLDNDKESTETSTMRVGALDMDWETDEQLNPDLKAAGHVHPHVWSVTMIDRADLVSVLTEELGSQDLAEEKIAVMLGSDCTYDRPEVIKLEPGRWHYYFVEDRINYGINALEQATDALGTGMKTSVMLSREPLELRDDLVRHIALGTSENTSAPSP